MRNVKKILCPVDFSDASRRALATALDLAQTFSATVLVVHVLDEPLYALDGVAGGAQVSALAAEYETAMTKRLHELLATLDGSVPVHGKLVRGVPATTIAELAEKESCDLLVMGTHGRTGLEHMLIGSVTERVLRVSSVPVLTVRTPRA